jgi:AraC family transcriptional regulator
MFELYSEDNHLDEAEWEGVAGEIIALQLPVLVVNRLLHVEGIGFHVPTRYELFDERLVGLVGRLWEEAKEGGGRGKLYADGLTLALLGLLVESHGVCRKDGGRSQARLSRVEYLTIRDFIQANLSSDLSVDELAALVGLSPTYFHRAFKASFGITPHAFVTDQRVTAACRLLRLERQQPIAEIAVSLGFSSQAHFSHTFRQRTGLTPGRWRAG